MFTTAPIGSRNDLGYLLNQHHLTGNAVEIGTHRGTFAKVLLDTWKGHVLYCVDPWSIPEGYEQQAQCLTGGGMDRQDDYRQCAFTLRPHGERAELVRATSQEACRLFQSDTLDFVYVDGDHSFNEVFRDLSIWWGKLKSGGILAGHDWMCPGEVKGGWGQYIQPAVQMFSEGRQVDVHLIVELNGLPWSYYMIKP